MRELKGTAFPPRSRRHAVDEELDFHLQERIDELVAEGASPEDARREVHQRFGDLSRVRRECLELDRQRDRRIEWRGAVAGVRDDARLALRSLVRSPRYALLVLAVLTLGLGATTAVWSVVDRVLFQPLPFGQPDQLVHLWQFDRVTGTVREPASFPDYLDFRERSTQLQDAAAYALTGANLVLRGEGKAQPEAERVSVALVSHHMLDVLGRAPVLGRTFAPEEDQPGASAVALVEESFWRARLQADPDVVGRTLELGEEPVVVVGVVPSGLEIPSAEVDFWLPLRLSPETSPRWTHGTRVVGRLADGASVELASEEISAIAADLEAAYRENADRGAFVESLQTTLRGQTRGALLLLLAAVFVVLVIACANVANIMLARGAERSGEVALSAALGASGWRVARRLTLECLLLTVAATLLGGWLAYQAAELLLRLAPDGVQRQALGGGVLDVRLLAFAASIALLTALLFGLLTSLQSRRIDLQSALRRSAAAAVPGAQSLGRRALVVAQFALALPLLCSAVLLVVSLDRLHSVDRGFRSEGVLRADYQLPTSRYPQQMSNYPRWTEVHEFNRAVLESARALPGVSSAGLTISHPLDPGFTNSFIIVGREEETADLGELKTRMVSPGYFETNGLELREGRLLGPQDSLEAPPVLLLNERAVERYFPDGAVLGQRIAFWGVEREVVGIVANERIHGMAEEAPEAMYLSVLQSPQRGRITLMVHTDGDPEQLLGPLRAAVRDIDPEVALFGAATMASTVRESLARERFVALVLVLFALAATLLAGLGVHGVLSFLVAARRREMGLRRALGATRRDVLRQVVGEGAWLAVVGVALGVGLSLGMSRLLRSLLYATSATDPVTYAGMAVLLLGLAVLACWLPARKAAATPAHDILRS